MHNKGCIFLDEGINFDLNTVCDCCISHNDGRGLPILIENYHGEEIDWENLFATKAQRIKDFQKEIIFDCQGCYKIDDYTFNQTKKISEFHFSHCRSCNSKCIYCSDLYSSGPLNYNTYPIIKDLIEKGYYKSGGEATFQGGEPTLMHSFDELIHLFTSNGTIVRVHTSAIRYSQTVANALKENKGSVVISIDSGCSSTYKRIKQVNAFDNVLDTITKYSQSAKENPENIIIKYIIIPGYNDSIDEIDKFFLLMKKLNIKKVALDIEIQYARKYENKDVSKHIFFIVDYFKMMAKINNIICLTYSFLSYVLNNRSVGESKLIKFKPLYKILVNLNNDKSKNIAYKR